MKDENKPLNRTVSPIYRSQIQILSSLNSLDPSTSEPRIFQIDEIAERSGVIDEREIQRYLFILEGQKLVSPQPEGDFTSKSWVITRTGMKALRTIRRATV